MRRQVRAFIIINILDTRSANYVACAADELLDENFRVPLIGFIADAIWEPSHDSVEQPHFLDVTLIGAHDPSHLYLEFLGQLLSKPIELIMGTEKGEVVPVDDHGQVTGLTAENTRGGLALDEAKVEEYARIFSFPVLGRIAGPI